MSLQNLYTHNNEILFCKKLTADNLDFGNVEVDHITVDNVTVLTTINTSNINSGTSLFNTIDTLTINAQTGNMGTINSQNINSLNITTENLSSQTFTTQNETVNNSTINNLTVNNSLTVPTLNATNLVSQTLTTNDATINNSLTVPTLTSNNIDSTNITISNTASINNLSTNTISTNNITSPLADIDNITSDNLTVNNTATINTLNVNTTITAPNISTNNITSSNGNISNLTSSDINCINLTASNNIISPNANLDTISGTNLTYVNGSIDQLNGSNVQYDTGSISDISGSNLTYDTGYIPTLSTKDLTVTSSIVSCPNANIDNLTVNNTFSAPLFEAPDMHVDYVRSYSVGKTTFQENVVVDTQFNCPVVGANTIITNGSGTVAFGNNVTGSNINLSGTMTSPNTKTNIIDTVSGSGFINFQRPLVLPNTTISSALAYYSYNTLTLSTSGCISTTISGFAVRVGNMITVYVQCFPQTTLATAGSVLFINGFPSQYFPNVGATRGLCEVNGVGVAVVGSYVFNAAGQLNIFSGVGGGGFGLGSPCGLFGAATDYASFSLITNI